MALEQVTLQGFTYINSDEYILKEKNIFVFSVGQFDYTLSQ